MKIKKTEVRPLQQVRTYQLEDEDIIDIFGSIERFKQVIGIDGSGGEPTEEEGEMASDLLSHSPVEEDNIMGNIEESFFEYE
jgi:hypothetical protein